MKYLQFLIITIFLLFIPVKVFASCEDISSNPLSEGSLVVNYINYGGSSGTVSSQSGGVLTSTNIESITQLTKTISTTFTDDYLILFGNMEFLVYGNDPSQNPNTPVVTNISSPMFYYEDSTGTINYSYCEFLPSVNSGIYDTGYIGEYNVSNLLTPQLSSFDFTLKCHRGPNFVDTRANYRIVFTFYYNSFTSNSFTLNSQYRINTTFRNRSLSIKNTCTNEDIIESINSINDSVVDVGDKLDNIGDFLADDSVSTSVLGATSFFNQQDGSYYGLADFVTAVINFMKAIYNDYSCTPLELPALLGTTITLPCFSEWLHDFNETIYNLWKMVLYFYVGFVICSDLIKFIHDLRDPQNDNLTVMDI